MPRRHRQSDTRAAFTLIELLVVIAILAVLATVIVVVINPAELLKKGRDTTRLSDLAALHSAISLYQVDRNDTFFGTSSVLYVSIPDTSLTCANTGLPALPSGWTYHCESTSTFMNVNGTGWLPVNLTQISSGSPLPRLPVDPVNTTSSGLYYTYTPGGSWELTTLLESLQNKYGNTNSLMLKDGGDTAMMYELGSDLVLSPVRDTNLIGLWKLDEGSGLTANDSSTSSNPGTLLGGTAWQSSCKSNSCASFDGINDSISTTASILNNVSNFSISLWVNPTSFGGWKGIIGKGLGDNNVITIQAHTGGQMFVDVDNGVSNSFGNTSAGVLSTGQWYHLVMTYDGNGATNADKLKLYVNGTNTALSFTGSIPAQTGGTNTGILYIGQLGYASNYFNGLVDDVRIYSHTLSPIEVTGIYNAQK